MHIEAPDFLPIGSIATLKGSDKKMMVISRGLTLTQDDGSVNYVDYGFTFYPEGLMGDAVIYSNHDCITEVIFRGYDDEENKTLTKAMQEVLPQFDLEKLDPEPADTW